MRGENERQMQSVMVSSTLKLVLIILLNLLIVPRVSKSVLRKGILGKGNTIYEKNYCSNEKEKG
jgi:hypothetical protein